MRLGAVRIWLVETEISSVLEEQYLSSISTGANFGENARIIFQKLFHKNEDIPRSCGQILLRSFQNEDNSITLRS